MKKLTLSIILLATFGWSNRMNAQSPFQQYKEKWTKADSSLQQDPMNKTNNSNYLMIAEAGFDWQNASWAISDTTIYTYDANNNLTSRLGQNWNAGSSVWVNNLKYTSTYDANNNRTSGLGQEWDKGSSVWVNYSKHTVTYDANNNETSYLYQDWDAGSKVWVNYSKYTSTYDANNNQTSELVQEWDAGSSVWENSSLTKYYYKTITGIEESKAAHEGLVVYPNPSDGNFDLQLTTYDLRLNNAEVRIYNLLGEAVYQQTLNSKHETLNTKLTNGVYFLQLVTEEGVWNEKIIVQ